jgi:hypothetical protein
MSKSYILVESQATPGKIIRVFVNQIVWFAEALKPLTGSSLHFLDGKGLHVKETPEKIEELLAAL